jgi:UDP-N-acetylglucosamine acyltransferase
MKHPTAIVHPGARLADDVEVGAWSIIGEHVEIGAGTWIGPHVVITGHTRIGANNRIFQFNSLGEAPQDIKYAGEPTRLEIGDRNTIREFCTLNCGTVQDQGVTRVGSDNNAQIAGHVHVGDHAILGGMTGVHQFVHIGAHSITAGQTLLLQDLPPYVVAAGNPAKPFGINAEGLKRRGFSVDAIAAIKRAYKTLYRSELTLADAQAELEKQRAEAHEVAALIDFLATAKRGIIR